MEQRAAQQVGNHYLQVRGGNVDLAPVRPRDRSVRELTAQAIAVAEEPYGRHVHVSAITQGRREISAGLADGLFLDRFDRKPARLAL